MKEEALCYLKVLVLSARRYGGSFRSLLTSTKGKWFHGSMQFLDAMVNGETQKFEQIARWHFEGTTRLRFLFVGVLSEFRMRQVSASTEASPKGVI